MRPSCAQLRTDVSAARDVLGVLTGLLQSRVDHAAVDPSPLGSWSGQQEALVNAIVAMDTIRVNAAVIPASLRSFVA